MSNALISATGLGIKAAGRWLIHDIDVSIEPGEVVTVIGPNGAGKTTMIRALLGLMKPDAGSIERQAGLTIGYVPQKLSIDPTLPLTVRRLMTLMRPASRAEVESALAETDVAHLIDRPVQALSGGETQRVLLARALVHKPKLLILDEPVQGVDYAGEAALYQLIGAQRDKLGCGILMVSHDLHVVMASTNRVVCLNGHICCSGQPREVNVHPEYHRLFGDRVREAYAVYQHAHDHHHDADGRPIAGQHHDGCDHGHEPSKQAAAGE
ncbi:MAG: zinc ABC transporter ATP-binding protein ZnuC [Alphaproteobacteria bacterium]|nr:zinc ABC transporter ATP-binding protein ZnuC [Alphaproteobacteria bacterium SS10]